MHVWISRDAGSSWNRVTLAIGGSGTIVVVGRSHEPTIIVWRSDDLGETWASVPSADLGCCLLDIAATPTDYVIGTYVAEEGAGEALAWHSPDAIEWADEELGLDPRAIAWTPTFGLIAFGDESTAFGPPSAP